MWNTRNNSKQQAASSKQFKKRRKTVAYCLLLAAFCLLPSGCRMDMQDQPRYEYYEPSKFYADGQASRPLVEGTVPRGAQFREANSYLYSGKMGGSGQTGAGGAGGVGARDASVGTGAQTGGATGGVGAGAANVTSSGMGGGQPTGDVNVRGNTAGGIPQGSGVGGGNTGAANAAGGQASATGGPDVFPFPVTREGLARGEERFNVYCSMCHGMTGEGDGMIVRRGFRQPPSFHSEQLQPGTASASHMFDVITNGWGAMPSYSDMIPVEDRWRIIAYVRALQLTRRGKIEDVPAAEQNRLRGAGQTAPAQQQQGGGHATGEQHGGTQR